MSYNYADYQSEQPVYTDWHQPYQFHAAQQLDYRQPQFSHHPSQPIYQPPHHRPSPPIYQPLHHPIASLDLQQSYPQDRHFHPQHHPYHARQPTCWDPPWVRKQQSSSTYDQSPPHSPYLAYGESPYQGSDPNNTDLMDRSFSPAQLSAVNDYNEKLRVYRLDQAALLARVTAWFEENTNDDNIADHHHGPSSSSRPATPAVPPPPPQRSSSCWSTTSPTSHCSLAAPMPAAAAAPSFNLPPRAPPCSPDICGDEGEVLDDDPLPPAVISQQGVPNTSSTLVSNSMQMEVSECDNNEKFYNHSHDRGWNRECIMYSHNGGKLIKVELDTSHPIELKAREFDVFIVSRVKKRANDAIFAPNQRPCVFDPGGVTSKLLLSLTLFVTSWFPP